MRFSIAHKSCTYLMVWCAYFALVLSGELGAISSLLSFVAIIGSWWWEPPRIRYETFGKWWTALSIAVFAWSVLSALTGDILIAGAEFLIYLMVAKLFNRKACKDYQQVYVLSFLMLVAGTVLNTQVTYGIFFLGYVVTSTWALILFHLRREMEDNFLLKHSEDRSSERVQVARILNSRRIVGRSFFVGTSLVSISIFVLATLMFLMIPRVGFGVFFNKNRSNVNMAGFSDGVELGGHGRIKTDQTVVMRVKVDKEFEGRNAPYIHWRGVAFDHYEKGRWERSRKAPKAPTNQRPVLKVDRTTFQYHLLYTERGLSTERLKARIDGATRQEIFLEPTGYDVLFGAAMPLAFELEDKPGGSKPRLERNDEMRQRHTVLHKYVVHSDLSEPDPNRLRNTHDALPVGYQVYLQIPDEVPERVRQLANEITKDKVTRYDKVKAIETWLRNNLSYTLNLEDPGKREPIDHFLFERKKGHCEYFSSTMAIMVRAIGAPSRNVNGFLGGEWNEYKDYIAVRAGDAHSWVEVYFHGVGWVTFDPTPSADLDQLGRGGSGVLDKLRRFGDTIRFKWAQWVIEYDLYQQLSMFRKIGKSLRFGAGGFFKGKMTSLKKWASAHKTTAAIVAISLGSFITLLVLWRRRRQETRRMLSGLGSRKGKRSPVALVYAATLAKLAKRGHRRASSTTPREHAHKLLELGLPGAGEFSELTELYYRSEYSGRPVDNALERARSLRRAVEQALASS